MIERALKLIETAAGRAVQLRRDLHRHPELGLTEFRTASLVARRLTELGLQVQVGRSVMAEDSLLGLPPADELEQSYQRALADGADPEFAPLMRGGFTGVVAVLEGAGPGPTVALRADMDALPIAEADGPDHLPARDGFQSRYPGLMHACGHDGHTAIALGVAEVLAPLRAELAGRLKLIFQPAEEGCRGAYPMMKAGVVDDVDYFLAFHIGMDAPSGAFYPQMEGWLATTKLNVRFTGRPAHAGGRPEMGHNALLGAAQAALGLHAISRHSGGESRINVGMMRAGSGRNIIPDEAVLQVETRGEVTDVDRYMLERARSVIEGAALAWDLQAETEVVGQTVTTRCDPALVALVAEAAAGVPGLRVMTEPLKGRGSEDAMILAQRVQERGGLAVYCGVGTDHPDGHHTRRFDLQEQDLAGGIGALALGIIRLLSENTL